MCAKNIYGSVVESLLGAVKSLAMHARLHQLMHSLPCYAVSATLQQRWQESLTDRQQDFDGIRCCAMLCCAVLCRAMLRHAMLRHAMLFNAMPCYSMLCRAVPRYAMLCYAMLSNAMSCYAMLCCAVLQVARIVGVNEGYIGQRCRGGGAQSDASAKHARFAAACALNAMLCEQSAWTVEQTWGLPSSLTQQGHPLLKHELAYVNTIKITLLSPRLSLPASISRPAAHCWLAVLWGPCYVSYVSKARLWACCPP